ncbi:MAG: 16S rRNA (cytosine(1402)-N(4))-methyltransferase [Candidatus Staskawiczbacteria bacterium RIFCSPLOWO2_01_FULL_38_12b]|uniref:Ribosomal RNA small subunit methyltransferase H n=1 Tax=Candidatus Staskawiczbacteria bacterium RIFCSPLOWO2_01_FULL_38_12b TaxID=1802214 RepID=A0A1G2IG60_9BACT|nr:MAG: 16S rRNA (cytosine(1402)-N(4))-methyltransferase [Candidatus Staskawiczbacteria bacterium RIFCSPLOWO2_01_FULL_38_12b]
MKIYGNMTHIPVLTKEVLEYLDPKPNENMIDATIGEAGHALLLLEKTKPDGRVLGIDLDAKQIEHAKIQTGNFSKRVVLVNDSYANIKEIVQKNNVKPIFGILLDLGYSSWQIEQSTKGFSFKKDEILDMRYDLQDSLTAQKIVNEYPEREIIKILQEYGQERFAKQIAGKITEQRNIKRIQTTFQLKEIIEHAVPKKFQYGRIHCVTKSFQALRIAVNRELDNLASALPSVISVLSPGGRLVVISFHSLEDRMVKHFFKNKEKEGVIKILTPKPISAGQQEILENPRSRSAKLRAIIKNEKIEV